MLLQVVSALPSKSLVTMFSVTPYEKCREKKINLSGEYEALQNQSSLIS